MRVRLICATSALLTGFSSYALAQQAPLFPRAGSGAIIYFQKGVSDAKKQAALRRITADFRTFAAHRQFEISVGDNNHILVTGAESRSAQFSLGATKASSGDGDKGGPITPAFILQGLRSQVMIGFNVGDPAEVKTNQGATLLSPGSSTQGVNVLGYWEFDGVRDQEDLFRRAAEYEKELNGEPYSLRGVDKPADTTIKASLLDALAKKSEGEAYHHSLETNSAALYYRGGYANYKFTNNGTTTAGSVINGGLGYQRVFESFDISGQSVQIGLCLGLTARFVTGDIAERGHAQDANGTSPYKSIFNTANTVFWGPELTLYARGGDAVPYLRVSHFGGHLDGFSGWQAVIGIDVFPKLFGSK